MDRRQTKNRRDRTFPIQDELLSVFQGLRRGTDSYVFHGPRGGHLKPDTVRTIFLAKVIEPLKEKFPTPLGEIGFEHGRLHSFRHFFTSRCANEGVPLHVVMSWLGHSSSEMVRLYYHLHDDEAQRHMKRIDFAGVAGGDVAASAAPGSSKEPQAGQPKREAS